MSQDLFEAYKSIYLDEARAADPAAREAAAKRLEALKKDPKNSPYSKQTGTKFGKYSDVWSHDPRADADFEKANKQVSPSKKSISKYLNGPSLTKEEILAAYLIDQGYALSEETAQVMSRHMSEEWVEFVLNEMRKEDKVAGKKSGGVADPAYREVKKMMRGIQGTPEGQRKKVPGQKPPKAGEYGGPMSPKTKVSINRARAQEGERNMSSRFD